MPELPEVETIRSGLADVLPGKRIAGVDVEFEKSMPAPRDTIDTYVPGSEVMDVRRRGKIMIIDLSSGYSLLVHLKMTGQLVLDAPVEQHATRNTQHAGQKRVAGGHPTKSMAGELPDKSTRVIFTFEDDSRLFFNDQRKFGWIKLAETQAVDNETFIQTMGPEPLGMEFGIRDLEAEIRPRKTAIKNVLLDQNAVAGLGNIYSDEALHLAKIHPLRSPTSLSQEEIERLHAAILTVLQNSIDDGGTSFTNYVNADGITGDYLKNARVYRREGEPCPECGTVIEKIKVGQRGTHICPQCQLLNRR